MIDLFSRLMNHCEISRIAPIYRGKNSRVFRLFDKKGYSWCGKVYAMPGPGGGDRLATEWLACSLIRKLGRNKVPRPVVCSPEDRLAVFEWVTGQPLRTEEIGEGEILEALDFLSWIQKIKYLPDVCQVSSASEACFSLEELLINLEMRFDRVSSVQDDCQECEAMHTFVSADLRPAFNFFAELAHNGNTRLRQNFTSTTPIEQRILSPSDFGFHNALRTLSGIVWLDFEYFGWDDPAKTMADFALHPAMDLGTELNQRFWQGMEQRFNSAGHLLKRAQLLYPLYGIKWCLIILNEFVFSDLERRGFAANQELDKPKTLQLQLNKAKALLDKIKIEHDRTVFSR